MKSHANYSINGWMLNELGLRGNNLLVFANIYSFSKDGASEFTGSLKFLIGATGASKNTVIKSLTELLELGFITKRTEIIGGITLNKYSQNEQVVQKLVQVSSETGVKGSSETGNNNTNTNNTIYNKENLDFKSLLIYYNKISGFNCKVVNDKTRKNFSQRLKEGYSKSDIKNAIDNAFKDEFHKKENFKYVTLEFISRQDKFDRYASLPNQKNIETKHQNGDIYFNI